MTAEYKNLQELFADPARHTTRAFARDQHDSTCEPCSVAAQKWCVRGGCRKIYGAHSPQYYTVISKMLAYCTNNFQQSDIAINDGENGYQLILAMCKQLNI